MSIEIISTDFTTHELQIKSIRETVFIKEQGVPVELEWDKYDMNATHILAIQHTENKHIPIGTCRILNNGHIGRMAVLSNYRNKGVGSKLLDKVISLAQQRKQKKVFLSAQTSAIAFYSNHGFSITSDVFMDAGIPHKDMELAF